MIGRRITVSACIVGALLTCAIAAADASAVSIGTTAFACSELDIGVGKFVRHHCRPGLDSENKGDEGEGKFEDKPIGANVKTLLKLSNEKTANNTTEDTPMSLKSTIVGTPVLINAAGVHSFDSFENSVDAESGEHYAHGEGAITLTGVTVGAPSGCGVSGVPGGAGTLETKQLRFTTTAQGMSLKFEPKEGTTLAEFEFTGAECILNEGKPKKLVGSIKGVPNGATMNFDENELTTLGNLRLGSVAGPKAGLSGSFTATGMAVDTEDPTAAVTFTTVETK